VSFGLPLPGGPDYKRIYFDSNAFIRANWPDLGQALTNTLTIAKAFGTKNILLDVVEKELGAHWFREYEKRHFSVLDKLKSLQKMADHLQIEIDINADLPELADIDEQYELAVDNLVYWTDLVRAKPTLRDAREFFHMAVFQKLPFKEKGRNFQDAVICLAAIDDLASSGEKVGALVSGDEIFSQEVLDGFCNKLNVSLVLFNSVDSIYKDLMRLLNVASTRQWQSEKDLAVQAIRADLKQIEEFVEKNLELPLTLGISDWIVELGRIELVEVISADTPVPWENKPGDATTISANLRLNVHAVVHRQIVTQGPAPMIKVGVPAKRSIVDFSTQEKSEVLERSATVEIKAKRTELGYSDLEPSKVSLVPSPFPDLGTSADAVGASERLEPGN